MNIFRRDRRKLNKQERKDIDLIKELASILKEHGDRILSGQVLFSLNTISLTCLNQSLAQISEEESNVSFDVIQTNNSKLAVLHDLQFLYDFIQKIIALKLVHGNATLQGRVNIYRFRNLKVLEIKKIPIHLVIGLQSLRPSLESISCSRSVQSLEGLFAKCGGDMAQEFTWNQLKIVDLSYNGIETIDDSLKLLPYLETLNLSHNNLKFASNLQHATVLKKLSLAFNCLYECPALSSSSRGTLVSLNVSYNNLESLKGIDELCGLEELDVSGNCLVGHSILQRIMLLKSLKSLNLKENPLSYHKRHREFTIGYLHPETSNAKFLLDGKCLSKQEQQLVKKIRVFSINSQVSNTQFGCATENELAESFQSNPIRTISNSLNPSIIDLENSVEYSSSPATRRKTRKTSKIVDAVIMDPTMLETTNIPTVDEEIKKSDEHLEIKTKIQVAREKFGNDWLVAGQKNIGVVPKIEPKLDSASSSPALNCHGSPNRNATDSADNTDAAESNGHATAPDKSHEMSPDLYDNNGNATADSSSKDDLTIDNGSFYVVHTENDENGLSYIISLGSRYITEKDSMTGKVLDELDLHSLIRYQESDNNLGLSLIFDYVKKSRRERTYHFEDESQLNDFCKQLEPFITARSLKVMKKGALQCLKCGSQFFKNNAISIVKTVKDESENPVGYSGSEGVLTEVPACPNCKSDMIVEMDYNHDDSIPVRKASTPLSSSSQVSFIYSSSPFRKSSSNHTFEDKVQKVFKDDAVVYSPHVPNKVEIEVEAEVYNLQVAGKQLGTNNNVEKSVQKNGVITRTDSDISILSNPSESSIAVLSNQNTECHTSDDVSYEKSLLSDSGRVPADPAMNNSSSDSLSDSVCTQLETSAYEENTFDSSVHGTESVRIDSNGNENPTSIIDASLLETSDHHNFTDLDYRIKLHLSMTLFDKDEDFRGFLNAGIMNYQKLQEFDGVVLLSNNSVYILKIIGEKNVEEPQNYLQKLESKDLSQLKYITVLYGKQGIQLEFVTKGKPIIYNVFIRDSEICNDFMSLFIDIMNNWSKHCNAHIPLISTSTKNTLQHMKEELMCKSETEDGTDYSPTLYIMGFWYKEDGAKIPASFIFTETDIYATQENYEWPVPWSFSDVETNRKSQFQLLDQQKIINITEIECDPLIDDTAAKVQFLNEDTMEEIQWKVSMKSVFSMTAFISAIRRPWEELFGVDLNMSTGAEST